MPPKNKAQKPQMINFEDFCFLTKDEIDQKRRIERGAPTVNIRNLTENLKGVTIVERIYKKLKVLTK